MPANRFGIDVGGVLSDVESIKGKRLSNLMAGVNVREAERAERDRPGLEVIEAERKNMLSGLRERGAGGDVDAQRKLLALDPEGGPAFVEAIGKMDERQLAATKRNVKEMGQMAGYVLSGKTPEIQAQRYETMRMNVSPEVAKNLPDEYTPDFMQLSLSKAAAMDQILEAPTSVQVGGEDVSYRLGQEVERADVPVKGGGSGAGGMKSADEALMYKMSAELLGGIFDERGKLISLDPQARNRAQSIATEASNLFARGGITRAEAVKRSARKFDLDVQAPKPPGAGDPKNIRKHLLNP